MRRIPRFYLPGPLVTGRVLPLDERVFHHAVRVLRLGPAAPLILFNGQGSACTARLCDISKRGAMVQIGEVLSESRESPLRLTLAQGLTRGDRMDYLLQKAVELGVTAIQPVVMERSRISLTGERLTRRMHHWQGILIGACEQCGRNHVPELRQPLPLSDCISKLMADAGLGLVLDPRASCGLRALTPPKGSVVLLVGSEGGLSAAEVTLAETSGWLRIHLGPRILRAETAGLAALAAIQALWGDGG